MQVGNMGQLYGFKFVCQSTELHGKLSNVNYADIAFLICTLDSLILIILSLPVMILFIEYIIVYEWCCLNDLTKLSIFRHVA